ncbi:MAG: PD-(D/E)XK nuclease family protein [Gammaproteobacteria bacterium]|nr:PD-(D/E)XK nuclease family protein [Gammaproteobacteria bacterium]
MPRHPAIFAALEQAQSAHALVLTGNNRLRRSLLGEWEAEQVNKGGQVWQTPNIQPFRAWLNNLWLQSLAGRLYGWESEFAGAVKLSETQAERLWLDAISRDKRTVLVNRQAAARTAHRAWKLLEQWQLRDREWPQYCSDDKAAFSHWRQQVERKLAQEHWIDSAQLPSVLTQLISETPLPLPKQVYLAGLQALSPQENAVLMALAKRGVEVTELSLAVAEAQPRLLSAPTVQAEIEQAASWARQTLLNNPAAQLGIVLLKANQQQLPVRKALQQSLQPQELWSPGDELVTEAFNFSLGEPLSRQTVVRAALTSLQWLQTPLPVEQVATLLQSPWLAGFTDEQQARTQWARLVLESKHPLCSVSAARQIATKAQLRCASLLSQIDAAQTEWQRTKESLPASLSAWLQPATECLKKMGWARPLSGDPSLDSLRWQAVTRFNTVLSSLAELDLVASKHGPKDFLQALVQAADKQLFQPQGSAAPVQVLGPLETIGQRFDALWVLGVTDDVLPESVQLDPYIPREWQRELGLPRASSVKEQAWAEQLVALLSQTAEEVVFSCALSDGDSPLRPAQVVSEYSELQAQDCEIQSWVKQQTQTAEIEEFEDNQAPAIAGEHPVAIEGGSRLFEDQSACAFRAFARWRLNARAIELPSWGISKQDLGNQLHRALEILWQRLQNHSALNALSEPELSVAVRAAVVDAEPKGRHASEPLLAESLRNLEMAVLHPLILAWLKLEKSREPFSVVGKEEKLSASVARLRLQLSVDRIDQLEDGRLVVTDYKTSDNLKVAAWNPERPEQPQLPLYAVQLKQREQKVAAVMFAQLAPGKVQALGLTEDENVMQGLSLGDASPEEAGRYYQPDLATLFPAWEEELEKLANEFTAGDAAVAPKNPSSCYYCDLKPLCRVDLESLGGTGYANS